MEPVNIDTLIERIVRCVDSHKLAAGSYARWIRDSGKGGRNLGRNEYGCADAANILYTVGRFPKDPEERAEWVRILQSMQDPVTGMFSEPTHHTIHTTAHCISALELFDASPKYRCAALDGLLAKDGLYGFLENEVDWQRPWPESHKGAGILPCFAGTGVITQEWLDLYFDWMWEHSDPGTGFFYFPKNGEPRKDKLFRYMAGGFHYIFNHEYERRPLRYPEKIVDSCLLIMKNGIGNPEYGNLLTKCGFLEIDVVYSLTRAMRYTPHRFYEAKAALEDFAEKFVGFMYSLDPLTDDSFGDLHMLFGSLCCLAELQTALPGRLKTVTPLKIVLDRRPFI